MFFLLNLLILFLFLSQCASIVDLPWICNQEEFKFCLINIPVNTVDNISISTSLNIIILSTSITCQIPCSINITSFSSIQIINSKLYSSSIYLYSSHTIDTIDSSISTNGTVSKGKGYTNLLLEGFGYAGMGSVCIWWEELIDNSYGPNCVEYEGLKYLSPLDTIGSGGIRPFEKGGGRIVIKASVAYFSNSNITASGYPSSENQTLCESVSDLPYLKGGTGGFILIETEEIKYNKQKITRIEAKGGYYCDLGWGGSGGRINIVSKNVNSAYQDAFQISINGGKNLTINEEFCSNGASGTLCLNQDSIKTFIINGSYSYTLTPTILASSNINLIEDIYVINNGLSSLQNRSCYNGVNLHIIDSEFEDFAHTAERINIIITFKFIEIIKSKVIFHQNININADNMLLSTDSSINFYKSLYIYSIAIIIEGKVSASQSPASMLIIQSGILFINDTAHVSDIEYIALYAQQEFIIFGNVQSFKQTCTFNLFTEKKFYNFIDNKNQESFESTSIEGKLFSWSQQNNQTNFADYSQIFEELLLKNYTIILLSNKSLHLGSYSSVIGAKIGVFSLNLTLAKNSIITTTAYGCSSDSGPGKGQSILHEENYCGGMGGSYGGYKGYGLGVITKNERNKESELCQSYARQIDSKEENLPYGGLEDPNYEGSGGGSGADNSKDKLSNKGGSGGGIIILGILNNLTNDGIIESNGESTDSLCFNTTGPGAGSGGSIQIYLRFLAGSGNITTNGGNSGFYCGEGGGGRIKIYFLNWNEEKLKDNLTLYWNGKILVESGQRIGTDPNYSLNINNFRGSSGTISVSPCLRGYHPAPLCVPCQAEFYKDNIGDGECKKCVNKPTNSKYTNTYFEDSNCTYVCNDNMNANNNPSCENAFIIYAKDILGVYGGICFFFLILLLLIGYLYQRYYKSRKNNAYDTLFNIDKATEKISVPSIISEELKKDDAFTLTDLLYHVHRIYVYGTNRYDNRWYINPEPQQEIEYLVSSDKYKKFVEIFNRQAKWSRCLGVILRIICMCYYPFYWFLLQKIRRKKYKTLLMLIKMQENALWKVRDPDDLALIKLKLSVSEDLTLCFIDIFNYKVSSFKYFSLTCPFTIMLAGEGNFFKPFNLNLYDPFLKCLYFSVNKNKDNQIKDREKINEFLVSASIRDENNSQLHIFIKRFNKLASNIDFAALDFMFYNALENLAEFVREWNIKFFQKFSFRVDILVLQIPKQRFLSQQNKITILENKDTVLFETFIKDIHRLKTLYSSYDIRFAMFVFDIQQDVRKLDTEKISFIYDDEEGLPWSSNVQKQSICSEEDFFTMKEEIKRKNYFQNLKYPMIDIKQKNFVESSIRKTEMKILKFLRRYLALIRFVFMSHKKARFGKRITYFFVFLIMILDTFIFVVICINLTFDYYEDKILFALIYPGAIILAPIIGCVWISSSSYKIGKVFLMFNFMALMNCILNLFISISDEKNGFIQYSFKSATIVFKILLSYFGSSWLPHIKKYEY